MYYLCRRNQTRWNHSRRIKVKDSYIGSCAKAHFHFQFSIFNFHPRSSERGAGVFVQIMKLGSYIFCSCSGSWSELGNILSCSPRCEGWRLRCPRNHSSDSHCMCIDKIIVMSVECLRHSMAKLQPFLYIQKLFENYLFIVFGERMRSQRLAHSDAKG